MEIIIGIALFCVVIANKGPVADLFHLTSISGTNPEKSYSENILWASFTWRPACLFLA